MKINFQNNIIRYTLANIMPADEKLDEANKNDVNMNKSKYGNCPNQFH